MWLKPGVPAARQIASLPFFDDWFRLLDLGITNWPENDSPDARSDCHAWGCMPEIEVIYSIFGLTATAPGWQSIRFQPHWPSLKTGASCRINVPSGDIHLTITAENKDNNNSNKNGDKNGNHINWQLSTPVVLVQIMNCYRPVNTAVSTN